jgi:hypothetical protein
MWIRIFRQDKLDSNGNSPIEDEQTRKHIQILSARLYDLRERFMRIAQKINNDVTGATSMEQISDEGNIFSRCCRRLFAHIWFDFSWFIRWGNCRRMYKWDVSPFDRRDLSRSTLLMFLDDNMSIDQDLADSSTTSSLIDSIRSIRSIMIYI